MVHKDNQITANALERGAKCGSEIASGAGNENGFVRQRVDVRLVEDRSGVYVYGLRRHRYETRPMSFSLASNETRCAPGRLVKKLRSRSSYGPSRSVAGR